MNRRLSTALVLALLLVLVTAVTAFAQGAGPGPGPANEQGLAPQDGTGLHRGWHDGGQNMARRGTAPPAGPGTSYVDENSDGVCDYFVDEDGDGACDNCDGPGSGQMAQRGQRNPDGNANGSGMRRGGGRGRGR